MCACCNLFGNIGMYVYRLCSLQDYVVYILSFFVYIERTIQTDCALLSVFVTLRAMCPSLVYAVETKSVVY